MAKLKEEFLKSQTIKIYNTTLGRFYEVTREQLTALKESGKLDKKYDSMFEPEVESKAKKVVMELAPKVVPDADKKV